MNYTQYHCALPLTDISSITDDMIATAFDGINRIHVGGDAYEDILLGKFFPVSFCKQSSI